MADTNDNAEIQNKELKEFLVEVRTEYRSPHRRARI